MPLTASDIKTLNPPDIMQLVIDKVKQAGRKIVVEKNRFGHLVPR